MTNNKKRNFLKLAGSSALISAVPFSLLTSASAKMSAAEEVASLSESWVEFKTLFMAPEGRVIDSYSKVSHTEGQGFSMLIAAYAKDKQAFEQLWTWTQKLLRPDGLFSWKWDQNKIADENNATDGDILIAWALLHASIVFKNNEYAAQAKRGILAIKKNCIKKIAGKTLLLPGVHGFVTDQQGQLSSIAVNPSYWVFPALKLFKQIELQGSSDERLWGDLIDTGVELCSYSTGLAAGLPLDWLEVTSRGGIHPWSQRPAQFGYEAVRVPLYSGWAGIAVPTTQALVKLPVNAKTPDTFAAWYNIDGRKADYGAPPGFVNVRRQIQGLPVLKDNSKDYYSRVLSLLSLIALKFGKGF